MILLEGNLTHELIIGQEIIIIIIHWEQKRRLHCLADAWHGSYYMHIIVHHDYAIFTTINVTFRCNHLYHRHQRTELATASHLIQAGVEEEREQGMMMTRIIG